MKSLQLVAMIMATVGVGLAARDAGTPPLIVTLCAIGLIIAWRLVVASWSSATPKQSRPARLAKRTKIKA